MLDAARLRPGRISVDEEARLKYAINAIRSLRSYANMPIVLIPEDGPPGAAEHMYAFVKDMQPLLCMAEAGSSKRDGANRYGVPKTEDTTIKMKEKTLRLIASGDLMLSEALFSLQHCDKGEPVQANLDKLRSQMYDYRVLIKRKKGENSNDDLLVAVMTLVTWADYFITARDKGRPEYTEFHRRYLAKY